ncbi:MAG TPA: hypothetical protein VFL81_01910, partial [Candidatus Saccharimonadales bacterium]|nr:hypothetical protein [Candidatus Saccharimonadales bacterium]
MIKLRTRLILFISTLAFLPLAVAAPAGAIASPLNDVCKTNGAGSTALCQENKQTNQNSLN